MPGTTKKIAYISIPHLVAESSQKKEHAELLNQKAAACLQNYSPRVENPHPGGYYLDLTGTTKLWGRELETCGRILKQLKERFGLEGRCGIGSNTLVSRIASEVVRNGGVYSIYDASEKIFLFPIHVGALPDVCSSIKKELFSTYNIRRIGDLKAFSRKDLECMFGKKGAQLYHLCRGKARTYLVQNKKEKTLKKDAVVKHDGRRYEHNSDEAARRCLFNLTLELCISMREESLLPRAVEMVVIYQDDYHYTHTGRLKNPSVLEKQLYQELVLYLNKALSRRVWIKKIVLSFYHFTSPSFQQELFANNLRGSRLAKAVDTVRKRFGEKYIGYGVQEAAVQKPAKTSAESEKS